MARPALPKEQKKTAISLKLPPYLIDWMNQRPENRAVLIENALMGWYEILPQTDEKKTQNKHSGIFLNLMKGEQK